MLLLTVIINAAIVAQTPDYEAQFKLGNQRFREKDYDGAIQAYSECLRLSPKQPECYSNRGMAYRQKSNFSLAIADYTEAIKYDPNNPKYYSQRARLYVSEKKYDPAINDYTQAIKFDANNFSYYGLRAIAYNAIEKPDLAIADLKSAIKIEPGNADLKQMLDSTTRIAAMKQEKSALKQEIAKDKEIVEAGRAIIGEKILGEINAGAAAEFLKSGKVLIEKKDNTTAILHFSECLRLKPDFADCYFYRGQVHHQISQYEKAVADFTQAIKIQPQNIGYYQHRANTNDFWLKRYDEAIADLSEVIKLQPKDSGSYMARGYVFKTKKDYQKALDDFTNAINIESSILSKKVFYTVRADLYAS